MSETSIGNYKHIRQSVGGDFILANELNHVSPPVDKHMKILIAMVLAGVGFLLPYNSFILAVDFYQDRYPNSTIMFDMSIVYIITAFFAVLLNNIFVEILSLNTRITFGYAVSLLTMIFVLFFEINTQIFSQEVSYKINLLAVGTVALGCTIQQSSYYGYTSMLPTKYTQAVMAGESAAGVWVSLNRIITKLLVDDEKLNTEAFFGLTSITLIICWILYSVVRKTEFVEFYITLCQESRRKITLEPTENAGLMDLEVNDTSKNRGDKTLASTDTLYEEKFQEGPSQFTSLSFANPVYEPTGKGLTSINQTNLQFSGPTFKVEDVIIRSQSVNPARPKTWTSIKDGIKSRWLIAQQIYPYMVFIALVYFVTLCLYPGILSEIISCRFGSWMPIILMTIFNFGDLIGKMFAPTVSEWARSKLAAWCSLRLLLLPLLLMCCVPRGSPHAAAAGDFGPAVLSLILGMTGGALGAAPMLAAGQRVRNNARELAGNIMTLSYNIGLTAGSLVAYLLEAMLGPQTHNQCGAIYPTIGSFTRVITSTTVSNITDIHDITTTTTAATTTTSSQLSSTITNEDKITSLYINNITGINLTTLSNEINTTTSSFLSSFYMSTTLPSI